MTRNVLMGIGCCAVGVAAMIAGSAIADVPGHDGQPGRHAPPPPLPADVAFGLDSELAPLPEADEPGLPPRTSRFLRAHLAFVGRILRGLDVFAADTAPDDFPVERFEWADADGDGEISNAEWDELSPVMIRRLLSRLALVQDEADADDNGRIGPAELQAYREDWMARMFEFVISHHPDADLNADGALSQDEFDAFQEERAAERRALILDHHPEADLDADGVLSEDELLEFAANLARPMIGAGRMHRGIHDGVGIFDRQ